MAENNEKYEKIEYYQYNISPLAIQENWNTNKVTVLFHHS